MQKHFFYKVKIELLARPMSRIIGGQHWVDIEMIDWDFVILRFLRYVQYNVKRCQRRRQFS